MITAAVLSAAVTAALFITLQPTPEPSHLGVTRFTVQTADSRPLGDTWPVALSPDGRTLAYSVGFGASTTAFLLDLAEFEPRPLEGGEGGDFLFFSPDSDVVGFHSTPDNRLHRTRLSGGASTQVVESAADNGASWGDDGTLVFASVWGQPLRILRPGDTASEILTKIDTKGREGSHLWPQVLPGSNAVLFTAWTTGAWDEAVLAVADIDSGAHEVVLRDGTGGRYTPSGHLVFWRGGSLMAVPFDADRLVVKGEPVKVIDGVRLSNSNGAPHFAVSETGTLAYVPGRLDSFVASRLIDRDGEPLMRLDEDGPVEKPVFSPDGRRIAVTLLKEGTYEIGVFDLERGLMTQLTAGSDNLNPSWTPQGNRITYISNSSGSYSYYTARADGSDAPQALFASPPGYADSTAAWTPDGKSLAYARPGEPNFGIWLLTTGESASPTPLLTGTGDFTSPAFSPDGKLLAHESNESGSREIYVRPFPNVGDARWQISTGGGNDPVWRSDGRELLYFTDRGIMSAAIVDDPTASGNLSTRSELLIEMQGIGSFDLAPDGKTLAISRRPIEDIASEIHVVLNWFEELERLVPTD